MLSSCGMQQLLHLSANPVGAVPCPRHGYGLWCGRAGLCHLTLWHNTAVGRAS